MKPLMETWILAFVGTADAVLTAVLVQMGTVAEANPILAYYLGFGVLVFLAIKMFLVVGPLWVLEYLRHRYPKVPIKKWLRIGLAAYLLVYFGGILLLHLGR